jgi:signal transduction histidine kinase
MGSSIYKFIVIFFLIAGCYNPKNNQYPIAESGVLDLSKWNFDQYPEVNLEGEWNFYWNKLFSDDRQLEPNSQNIFAQVPGVWNNKKIQDKTLGSLGYATYHLKIYLPPNMRELGIYLSDDFQSVYSIWINGNKKAWNGIPGNSIENTNFDNHNIKEYILFNESEIDLVVEIANFRGNTRWGGLKNPLYLVTTQQARSKIVQSYFFNFFIFSFIFTIGIYNLIISFQYKTKKKFLFFGIFSVFASIYTLPITNAWSALFPNIGQESILLIHFFLEISLPPLILAYYYSLFPKDINKFFLYFLTLFWLAFLISIFVVPIQKIIFLYQYSFIISLTIGLYLLIKSIKMYLTESVNSDFVFYSNFILFIFFLINGLNGIFNFFYIYPYSFATGLFIFIVIHTLMNSIGIAKSLRTADEYSLLDYRYKQLFNNQSEERSRIARDIHDSIGSELTAIISQSPISIEDPIEYNKMVRSQLNHLLINIRDIVYLLGKQKSNYEILESEILKYIDRLDLSNKFKITHNIHTISTYINKDQALNIQRIFLEIMTNTIRHAKAENIRINLKIQKKQILLIIIHDGNYFSWDINESLSESMGLEGIYFRIQKLNGNLKVFSRKKWNFLRISLIPGNLISLN